MFDVVTAVGSIKSAIDIAKVLKDGADTFDKAEVKLQLAELISSLADAKMQMAEVQELLLESNAEKKDLLNKLNQKEKIIYEKPSYFKINDDNSKDGPYCQNCYDANEKLIRLQGGKNDFWKCNQCDNTYKGPRYVQYNRSISCRAI